MKRIGTIKFYREFEKILSGQYPFLFKESLLIVVLDYLTHYKLSETELAMKNVKKYFYPELLNFYESIVKHYPQILIVLSELVKALGTEIIINSRTSANIISYNNNVLDKVEDNSYRQLFKLLLVNINERKTHDEFVDSIISFNNELDVFANVISNSVRSLVGTYNILQKSLMGGVEYFEYVDTKIKCRNFCKDKVGKHYHINDIAKMNNNEIGPVFYFAGGLGCYHCFEADPYYKKTV